MDNLNLKKTKKDSEKEQLENILVRYSNGEEPLSDNFNFGFEANKPSGYWKKIENVLNEFQLIMKERNLSSPPSTHYLKSIGRFDLSKAVGYHGGIEKIRLKLGFESLMKPKSYWNKFENVIKETKKFMRAEKINYLPTPHEIRKRGWGPLAGAIGRRKGLDRKIKIELGLDVDKKFENQRRPKGHWTLENTIDELKMIMQIKKWDTVPDLKILVKSEYSYICGAIRNNGGVYKIRQLMGCEQLIKKQSIEYKQKGYWRDIKNLIFEINNVMETHKYSKVPSSSEFQKLGHSDIVNAFRYHGGKNSVIKKMGLKPTSIEPGHWTKIENLVTALENVINEKNLNDFPSEAQLRQWDRNDILNGLRHHGTNKLRKRMGYDINRFPNGHWDDINTVLNEMKTIVKKHKLKNIPSARELGKLGHSYIISPVQNHGGFNLIRKLLGYEEIRKPNGFWLNIDNVVNEMKNAIEQNELKSFPTDKKLRELGYHSMVLYINTHHNGLSAFRECYEQRMKLPSEKQHLEGLLEGYAND